MKIKEKTETNLVISMLLRKTTKFVKLGFIFTPIATNSNSPIVDF